MTVEKLHLIDFAYIKLLMEWLNCNFKATQGPFNYEFRRNIFSYKLLGMRGGPLEILV